MVVPVKWCCLSLSQEESAGFITMENLDEKIEEALQNEVDYNFAISPTGQKIYDRYTNLTR